MDAAAAEIAKNRILPASPGKKISFEEMEAYFKLLTPEMWHHVVLYIYREHPKIIRQLKDPETPRYIDCLSEPIDMEYMIQHHGGGKYSLTACDTEAKFRSPTNKIFECDFEINSSKYEPKLNYEELDVNAKQNMGYVQLLQYRGKLDSKGRPMTEQPTSAAANTDIVKTVLDYASKMTADQQELLKARISPDEQSLSKSLGEILLAKMQQDDPVKQVVAVATAIKEVLSSNKTPDGSTQMFERMMQMNTEQLKQQSARDAEHQKTVFSLFEKMIEMQTRRPEPTPNPQIEQLEQVFSFAERLSGLRGRAGGGERNGWEIGLEYVKELGGPVFQTIGNIISMNRTGRPMPPVTTPGAANPATAFDPYANPAAMRAHSNAMAGQPAPAPAPAPAASIGAPPTNETTMIVQQCAPIIVQHLNMGTPGHVVGEYVSGFWGNATHAQICSQGEAALVQTLLSIPEVAIFGEARLRKFVNEFVNFQAFVDAEQEEVDDDEAETAGPVDGSGFRPVATGAR